MTVNRILAATLAALLLAAPATAQDVSAGDLTLAAAWIRPTPPGAPVSGGYLTITNHGAAADKLTGASAEFAEKAEIHEMRVNDGVMQMRPVEGGLTIGPGETVTLEPGGLHLMFMGLKEQMAAGERRQAVLTFEKAGKVAVTFPVGQP